MKKFFLSSFVLALILSLLPQDASAQVKVRRSNGAGGYTLVGATTTLFTPENGLGELRWADYDPTTLANGSVASFDEKVVGDYTFTLTQSTGALQPTKDANGINFTGLQKFAIGNQVSTNVYTDRWFTFVYSADYTSMSSGSIQPMFAFNGISGTSTNRYPAVYYNKTGNILRIYWGSAVPYVEIDAGASNVTHVLNSWKENGYIKVKFDGGTVTSLLVDEIPPRHTGTLSGVFGNNTATMDWTLKRLMIMQGEPTLARVEAVEGWAMWHWGVQANLPGGHPYVAAAPRSNIAARFTHVYAGETEAEWTTFDTNWNNAAILDAHQGEDRTALIAGLSEVFRDDMGSSSTLCDENAPPDGTCKFWTPVQTEIGNGVDVGGLTDPANLYSFSGGKLNASTTWYAAASEWRGAVFTSINREGRGYTWNPNERPTYFEISMANPSTGVDAWPAFWSKSINQYCIDPANGLITDPYTEFDHPEDYRGDNSKPHSSVHIHPPLRRTYFPSPRFGGVNTSDTVQLGASGTWPDKPIDLFDGTQYVYGIYWDRTTMIYTFGIAGGTMRELIRMATPKVALQPHYLLVAVAMWNDAGIHGTHTAQIDYIRVLQGAPYADTLSPESIREQKERVASNVIPFKPRKVADIRKPCQVPLRCAA